MSGKTFKTDSFVNEAIQVFMDLDRVAPQLVSESIKASTAHTRKIDRIIRSIVDEEAFSNDFKCRAIEELTQIISNEQQGAVSNNPKPNPTIEALIKQYGVLSPAVDLALKIPSLIGSKFVDSAIPKGRPPGWLFNVLICVLIAYGKKKYPKENHLAVLASKFKSPNFVMAGWNDKPSKRSANKRIHDRYKFMSENFDVKKICNEVHFAFNP